MSIQLEVICDCCGLKRILEEEPHTIGIINPDDSIYNLLRKSSKRKDLCPFCYDIVWSLLFKAHTPENGDFGAVTVESIRIGISKIAERRKQVFEEEKNDS